MFKINRRVDYAMRVMVSLARRAPETRLLTQVIQEEMQIPARLLRRIIADLAHAGLVNTFPGSKGGLELALPAENIQLMNIWEAIEGPLLISDCLVDPEACPLEQGCPVNRCWRRLQDRIASELESISLIELVRRESRLTEDVSFQKPASLNYPVVAVIRR